MKRDNYVYICAAAGLAAAFAMAAPEVRTFPVTVSNRVSGLLETVPLTFRFGEANGIVERLDGTRFKRVPVAAQDHAWRESLFSKPLPVAPEEKLLQRLLEVPLPPQRFAPTNLVGILDQLAWAVRRADGTNASPVRIMSRLPADCLDAMPAFSIPATNAWNAILVIAEEAGNVLMRAHDHDGGGAPLPVVVCINGGDEVFLHYDDDSAVTRRYSVPNSFWQRYPRDSLFHRDVKQKLAVDEWGVVESIPSLGIIRVTSYSKEIAVRFDEKVYEPLLEELLKPVVWEPVLCRVGSRSQLFLKGTAKGTFCGLWLYRADRIGDAIENDRLESCLVENGFAVDHLSGPRTYAFDTAHADSQGSVTLAGEAATFVLSTHDGTVARLDGAMVIPVERGGACEPLFRRARTDSLAAPSAMALLNEVIVPELRAHTGDSITDGIAQVQAAVRGAGEPTNRVTIGVDVASILAQVRRAKATAMMDGTSVSGPEASAQSEGAFGVNLSDLRAVCVSASDAIKLLAAVTGLMIDETGPSSIELVTWQSYTQRMTRAQTYTLPKPLCAHIPDARWWSEAFAREWVRGYRVASYVPATGELRIEAENGDFAAFEDYLAERVYTQFPGRFRLENERLDGREELVLTDSYRGVSARYRPFVRQDGSRAESFEVMK